MCTTLVLPPQAVLAAFSKLEIDYPMSAERIVGAGRFPSDGVGLDIAAGGTSPTAASAAGVRVRAGSAVTAAASPSGGAPGGGASSKDAAADNRPGLFDSGGVLANSTTTTVELGAGVQRDSMLAVLFLYQQLPQLVPKAQIEFRGALGATVLKTIELKNPTRRPIMYHVSLDASPECVRVTSNPCWCWRWWWWWCCCCCCCCLSLCACMCWGRRDVWARVVAAPVVCLFACLLAPMHPRPPTHMLI
jgi:hypothetical protein